MLRERAEAATPGPWQCDEEWAPVTAGPDSVFHGYYCGGCHACGQEIRDDAEVSISPENRTYIATMHPGVGLALADWLDAEADVPYYTPSAYGTADRVTMAARALADLILGGTP